MFGGKGGGMWGDNRKFDGGKRMKGRRMVFEDGIAHGLLVRECL